MYTSFIYLFNSDYVNFITTIHFLVLQVSLNKDKRMGKKKKKKERGRRIKEWKLEKNDNEN